MYYIYNSSLQSIFKSAWVYNRAIGFSDFLFVVHQISRKIDCFDGAVIIKFLKKLLKVLMKKMEMNTFFLIIFYVISSGQVVSW